MYKKIEKRSRKPNDESVEDMAEKWTKKKLFVMCYVYIFSRMNAQHCFAADAAGAAPDLGAILRHRGAPSLVPVSGGRQRRR